MANSNNRYKFRAWDKSDKKMLSPDYLFTRWDIADLDGQGYEIMQFTGLLDKNGKEIYEGDVINVANKPVGNGPIEKTVYEVYWNSEWSGWQGRFKDYRSNELWGTSRWIDIEIIGNIYENPELLK